MAEEYLGDGLYASWDGTYVMLRAPRQDGDHWVGLEAPVYAKLQDYAKRCFAGQVVPIEREFHIVPFNPEEG